MAWNLDNGTDPPQHGAGIPAFAKARGLWDAAGIAEFPWVYIHSLADVDRLIAVAKQEGSPAIGANIENVVGDSLDLEAVADRIQTNWSGPVHMATLPWVQNGQGWQHMSFAVAALEIFPSEQKTLFPNGYDPKICQDCIDHAFMEGLTKVTLMLGTYGGDTALTYGAQFSICHSLYTADDITPSAEAWNKWKAPVPCQKLEPPVPEKQWYEKPYLQGPPVGPNDLPRPVYPPSAGKGTFSGYDVTAYKRGISRAGRQIPWSPSTWSNTYGETFAKGDGSGQVGKSGVRGFQRQTWPNDSKMQTGNMGDKTYQAMRRSLISDPSSPNYTQPIFDATAVELLRKAEKEYNQSAKEKSFREHLTDFCLRAEAAASEAWTYSQARPYTGLGVAPEKSHRNDCSSYSILAYYWARRESELEVEDPSGYQYSGYGNTWDDLDGHPSVTSGNYLVGDLAHYDGHVTICRKAGDKDSSVWSSFGSEPKPEPKSLYYRPDFLKVVRPPL